MELRARVSRTIFEDLEQKVLALRALHAKFRDMDAGEWFPTFDATAAGKS